MVSIIIPIYNLENLISRCINSIITQTYANWELILVDDGSTDRSLDICKDFAKKDYRITVIHQSNAGASSARKTGVRSASGEWITFVDGDDELPIDAISALLSAANYDDDIIVGNITTRLHYRESSSYNHLRLKCSGKEYISMLLNDSIYCGPCGKLFRRDLFSNAKWNSNIPLSNYEDLLMLVALASIAKKIIIRHDLNVYTYILRDNSASKSHLTTDKCQILFNELSSFVDNNEAFFLFRLRRLYDNCIVNGEKLAFKDKIISDIIKNKHKYNLLGHDKIILLMLYSRILRNIVAKRHRNKIDMRKDVSVSIIISAYNEEKHIARAIKSAISQSLTNIEVIVVNDASTDKTTDIVASFSATDNRIRLISHDTNMGLNKTRITGLNAANGEFVTFIDGDDTIEPLAAEKLYQQAVDSACDIIAMGARRVTRFLHIKLPFFSPAKAFIQQQYNTRDLLPLLLGKNGLSLSLCDKLYRKDFIKAIWTYAEPNFYGEDMLTNLRIFNTDASLGWIDYIGYNYTTGGASKKSAIDTWNDDKRLYNRCRSVLEEINASTSENMHALACGAVNSFIYSISQQLVNPFASKRKCKEWINTELQSDFWDKVIPYLGSSHIAICNRDAADTLEIARQHLKAHRLSFLALKFLML